MGAPSFTDRFMIEGDDAGGRFALVEHTIAPGALAAPMHKHSKEDEFTYVLEGTFAAMLNGREIQADPGDLVFTPRTVAHVLEPGRHPNTSPRTHLTPAGLDQLFRLVGTPAAEQDPDKIAEMARGIGCDVDHEATAALVTRHGLRF